MRTLIILLAIMAFPAGAFSAAYYYVPDDFATIQEAIDASMNGDFVVVRAGTYVENIDFLGKAITVASEEGPEVTVVDGGEPINIDFGSVVTFKSGEEADSVLKGFTLTNGTGNRPSPGAPISYGGGVYCDESSPTIFNNIITNNWYIQIKGGGIYCIESSAIITKNTITGNATQGFGGGIYCELSTLTINCNTITGNRVNGFLNEGGGGIYCHTSNPLISNNLICNNEAAGWYPPHGPPWPNNGGGIYCADSSPIITNNTLSNNQVNGNGGGIYCLNSSPVIANTICWNNTGAEIHGGSPSVTYCNIEGGWTGTGNIDTDPLFTDPDGGDFHLDVNSPCIDAGDNYAPGLPEFDFEGDPRIHDGNCDGSDVADMGCDEFISLNVPFEYATIQSAIDTAVDQDVVLVAAGTYEENISFLGKAVLVKSFESPGSTIIDGGLAGSVVTFENGEGPDSVLEGFTIKCGSSAYGSGICCNNVSPTIRNNIVCHNENLNGLGGGIYCYYATPLLENNKIHHNEASHGGGVYLEKSTFNIEGNDIFDNNATWGGGVYCLQSSPKWINMNLNDNSADSGGGIECKASSPIFLNGCIYDNTAALGGGLFADDFSAPVVTNCTFHGNSASSSGGGIYCGDGTPILTNTILWNNTAPASPQIFGQNALVNYCDVQYGWPGSGNLDKDPLLVNPWAGQFHLSPDSTCINAGDNYAPELPDFDFEGDPRIFIIADMGVDETDVNNGAPIRVPKDYSSIQEAIDIASNDNDVIVAPGTFFETIDFKGKAIALMSQQGPAVTVIDGNQSGSVVKFLKGEGPDSVLKGFTITNGKAEKGGGINCEYSSPAISENIIKENSAEFGGGIWCKKSSPVISDNIIQENWAEWGGAFHGIAASAPKISGNTIAGNTAADYGGGLCFQANASEIVGNVIRDNGAKFGGGIYCGSSDLEIACNAIFGNKAKWNGGGIFCEWNSSTVIKNNTIAMNKASKGGGLYSRKLSSATVANTIFWKNEASSTGPEIQVAGTVVISCSDVLGGQGAVNVGPEGSLDWGTGMIDADPLFVDPLNNDFHLTSLSPCINRGTNEEAASHDIDGDPRLYMGTVDMGSDEYTGIHPLEADAFTISEDAGGTVNFSLSCGMYNAKRTYLVVGSLSGTAPGTPLPGGEEMLRLNWDLFTDIVLGSLNTPVFMDFYGKLDWSGHASAQLNAPPVPGLGGTIMHYAFCLSNPFDFVSNPVAVEVVP